MLVRMRMTLAAATSGATLLLAAPALATPSPARHRARVRPDAITAPSRRAAVTPRTASVPTLYVAKSGSDANNTCRLKKKPCLTINHAIDAAPPTATVQIAAGDYPEQLDVTKNLTFVGAGQSKTTIDPTSLTTVDNDPDNPGAPQAEIVTFDGTSGGGLTNLTVNGSGAAEPSDGSCDLDYVGVYFLDAPGTLTNDHITGIQEGPGFFGCQPGADGGVSVSNDNGAAETVSMSSITVDSYDKDGITCSDPGTTCSIYGSRITGIGPTDLTAQNGIELYDVSSASIMATAVSGNSYTSPNYTGPGATYYGASGVLAIDPGTFSLTHSVIARNDIDVYGLENQADYGGPAQGVWTIDDNSVTAATNNTGADAGSVPVPVGNGIGDGIDLDGPTNVTVQDNVVNANADWGIALFGTTDSTIGGVGSGLPNTVASNGDEGIYVGLDSYDQTTNTGVADATWPSEDDTISGNKVKGNATDGILADGVDGSGSPQELDNTFTANVLLSNLRYDAEDLSTGSGTAGTANTWSANSCVPKLDASPTGICTP